MFIWDHFIKLNQSLTEKRYFQLLGGHLQPFMHFTYFNKDEMFHDDNTPNYQNHIVRNWFEEHSEQC